MPEKMCFWKIATECAIAYNVQHNNMQSIHVTRDQPACFERLLEAALVHFVRTAEAACKLPWKKEVYVIRISQSQLFNSCRSSLVPYSHLTVLLWKEYCSCQH